ncbi:hypothetical protein, partial [Achromobacter xylosoxidans]
GPLTRAQFASAAHSRNAPRGTYTCLFAAAQGIVAKGTDLRAATAVRSWQGAGSRSGPPRTRKT